MGALRIRRVSVHAVVDGGRRAHDVAVCADIPVAELLTDVVDLIGADQGIPWRLERTTSEPIDASVSLAANGVDDGHVLVLTASARPTPAPVTLDGVSTIADSAAVATVSATDLVEPAVVWLALVLAVALGWAGSRSDPFGCAIIAAGCAAALCWRARMRCRAGAAVAGTVLAGTAGFLIAPGGPGMPNVMLGAAVTAATAVVSARLTRPAAQALAATAVGTALIATVAAVAVAFGLPVATAGAFLTTAGFAVLAVAPRCAMFVAGVPPEAAVDPPDDLHDSAALAHSALTALMLGSAVAITTGTVTVVWQVPHTGSDARAALAFSAVATALLLLRVRAHVDATRRVGLAAAGIATATATIALIASSTPGRIVWAAVALVIVAAVVDVWPRTGPTARRVIGAVDCGCAAMLIPLTCWIAGAYTIARNWVFL